MSGLQLKVLTDNGNGTFSAGGRIFDLNGLVVGSDTYLRVATIIDYAYQTGSENAFFQNYLDNLGSTGKSSTIQFYSDIGAWASASGSAIPVTGTIGLGGLTQSSGGGTYIYLNSSYDNPEGDTPYGVLANNTIHELLHTTGAQHYSGQQPNPNAGQDPNAPVGVTDGAVPYNPGFWPDVMNVLGASLSTQQA